MQVIHTEAHARHAPLSFVLRGKVVDSPECPERGFRLIEAIRDAGHPVAAPRAFPESAIAAVHTTDYLQFLATAHARWSALPDAGPEVKGNTHPGRHMFHRPDNVVGQAGYHMADGACPIGPETWAAARAAADCALTATDLVTGGARSVYALCRPPGHHAFSDMAGGFCFLNNVAIAAEHGRHSTRRVAILDIDVHHGNGTQGIFYGRGDVMFVSVHADPATFYPFFAGYATERGTGAGLGYNLNLPLPHGTGDMNWLAAIGHGLDALRHNGTELLFVSLGLDPQENDPLGVLKVTTEGFRRAGATIAGFGVPTVIIQEGGYLCAEIGANLAAFLDGFENG
ncbi:MAG: histone deacetylase family protein [Pseudomonadota bacterium]|nr:histone deacetylase family protein [Pseudomonadota bacterium]